MLGSAGAEDAGLEIVAIDLFAAAGGHKKDLVLQLGIANGGRIIHELGVTRMGTDPSKSVLNANCQAHDAKNLFVADGGPFVSQPDKNCTWTILALSMRTSEYIAEQRKLGKE